jgi:hypothetical protein
MTTSRFGRSPDRTIRQTISGAAHLGTHSVELVAVRAGRLTYLASSEFLVVHEDDEEER